MLLQETLIQLVKERSREDNRVVATMMYGSFTQGSGDQYSDVEFYIFIADDEFERFNTKDWISNIYPIYTHFFNEFGSEVTIFRGLVRGEFHFLPEKGMSIIDSFREVGYFPDIDAMCLYDSKGTLKTHLSVLANYQQSRCTGENIEFICKNLLNVVLLGVNVLRRGEIARSLEWLWHAQRYLLQLLRLKEHKTDYWVNPTKQLESDISSVAYNRYQLCTSNLATDDIHLAYVNTLAYCKEIMSDLSVEYDFDTMSELMMDLEGYVLSRH